MSQFEQVRNGFSLFIDLCYFDEKCHFCRVLMYLCNFQFRTNSYVTKFIPLYVSDFVYGSKMVRKIDQMTFLHVKCSVRNIICLYLVILSNLSFFLDLSCVFRDNATVFRLYQSISDPKLIERAVNIVSLIFVMIIQNIL